MFDTSAVTASCAGAYRAVKAAARYARSATSNAYASRPMRLITQIYLNFCYSFNRLGAVL